jgi:hypothetical protein
MKTQYRFNLTVLPRQNKLAASTFIACSLFASSLAFAKSITETEQALLDEGFAKVAEGLYADSQTGGKTANSRATTTSYIATNAAGRKMLSLEVLRTRDDYLKRAQADGIQATEKAVQAGLDRVMTNLAQPTSKIVQTGTCLVPNGATLRAIATSSGGNTASANARNALDFYPTTPTNNYAEAATETTFMSDNAVGITAASASASTFFSCFAYGYGSVTCPGESDAGVWAFESSQNNSRRCNQ